MTTINANSLEQQMMKYSEEIFPHSSWSKEEHEQFMDYYSKGKIIWASSKMVGEGEFRINPKCIDHEEEEEEEPYCFKDTTIDTVEKDICFCSVGGCVKPTEFD